MFWRKFLLVLAALALGSAGAAELVTHAPADGRAAFTFDAQAWNEASTLRRLPVGVFDSGIGGLTVLEAILTLDVVHNDTLQPGADGVPDFANERFIYFGDQANMPYGNYPAAGRTDTLRELIVKDAVFLLGRRAWPGHGNEPHFDKPPVKAIVIACNTATAYGLDDIRAAVAAWKVPVIVVGVVEAGARGVSEAKSAGGIGVLATAGTCASGVYPRTISRTLGEAGRSVPVIAQQGSATLAGAIEGDAAFPEPVAVYARREARSLAEAYRDLKPSVPLEMIVLGCTHYPLAENEIETAFAALREEPEWRNVIAKSRTFVNPATLTARELFRELVRTQLRLKPGEVSLIPKDQFYLSVPRVDCAEVKLASDGSLDRDYKYSRLPGRLEVEDTKNVPLVPAMLPAPSARLLRERLGAVWQRLALLAPAVLPLASGAPAATASPAAAMEAAAVATAATSVAPPVRREWAFAADGVTFDARFPTARLDACRRTAPDTFAVTIRPENSPINPSPWFAFTVRADRTKTIVVDLRCDGGPLRYRPKISIDGRSWITLPEEAFRTREKTGEGRLQLEVGPDPLWVAAQEIIGVVQLDAWGRALERLPFVTRAEIGRSVQGRPLHKLEIGRAEADAFLVVIGRQHPPETTGMLALMGFVETLAGDSALARDFRQQFCTLLMPLLNPDGVEHGHWRHNVSGVDLNRDWGPFRQPETRAARDQILALRERGRIFFFLDFHSTFSDVLYTRTDAQPTQPPLFIRDWVAALHSRFPDYTLKRSASASSNSPTSLSWMHRTFAVPAVTYEIGDNTDRARLRQIATGAAEATMTLLLQARAAGRAQPADTPGK
jgi:glutamate racemase